MVPRKVQYGGLQLIAVSPSTAHVAQVAQAAQVAQVARVAQVTRARSSAEGVEGFEGPMTRSDGVRTPRERCRFAGPKA